MRGCTNISYQQGTGSTMFRRGPGKPACFEPLLREVIWSSNRELRGN